MVGKHSISLRCSKNQWMPPHHTHARHAQHKYGFLAIATAIAGEKTKANPATIESNKKARYKCMLLFLALHKILIVLDTDTLPTPGSPPRSVNDPRDQWTVALLAVRCWSTRTPVPLPLCWWDDAERAPSAFDSHPNTRWRFPLLWEIFLCFPYDNFTRLNVFSMRDPYTKPRARARSSGATSSGRGVCLPGLFLLKHKIHAVPCTARLPSASSLVWR